jgi:hypothetical protein
MHIISHIHFNSKTTKKMGGYVVKRHTMIRREIRPAMGIILLSQIPPVARGMEGRIETGATPVRLVGGRSVRQMRSKDQHVPNLQGHRHPLVRGLPGRRDAAAVRELDGHPVRARHDLETAVLQRGRVDGEVGRDVLDAADVVVRRCVQVRLEAVSARLFVVDLVFEEEHVL